MNSPIALFPFHISSFVPKEVEISELQAMSMTVHAKLEDNPPTSGFLSRSKPPFLFFLRRDREEI
jgi:hypothetical protein